MTDDRADLDRLLSRLYGEELRDEPLDHPAPEKLSAYLAGELPSGERDSVQEHLVHCRLCTDMLLDLKDLLDSPPPAVERPREAVADLEAATDWRSLREKIRTPEVRPEPTPFRRTASLKVAYSLVAALAVGLVGSSLYNLKLYRELNVPAAADSFILSSSAGTRGPGPTPIEIELRGVPVLSLTLEKPDGADFPEYMAKFSRQDGSEVLTARGLHYQEDEGITLLVRRRLFEPGTYQVTLFGLRDGRSQKIDGRYRIDFTP